MLIFSIGGYVLIQAYCLSLPLFYSRRLYAKILYFIIPFIASAICFKETGEKRFIWITLLIAADIVLIIFHIYQYDIYRGYIYRLGIS